MPRRTSRYSVWLAYTSVVALLLTACPAAPQASPGGTAAATEAGGPTPSGTALAGTECPEDEAVTFWTSHTEPDVAGLQRIVESFNEQSGGACVTMIQVPGAETDVAKLMTAVRGGTGPDVYMLDRFTVAQRAADGVLTELPQAAELQDQYVEFAWNEAVYQGTPYALPFDTDARALFYRVDLLQEAGVSQEQIDSLDPANGPITLDELKAIADQVDEVDADGTITRAGFIPWINQGWHYTWGFMFGGEFADIEACEVTPTDPGVEAGFQYLYDWAAEKDPQALQTWASTYTPPNNPASQEPYITGNLAMVITGDWVINQMLQYAPDVEYGFTWLPVPEEGMESTTWAGGWSMVIPQGAQDPDGAWEFLQFAAGPEGQRIYTEDTKHLPTLQELLGDDSLFEEGQHAFFRELLEVARSRPPLPVGALYWDSLTSAQDAVTLNEQTPEEALPAVQEAVQPQLEQFCPLTG
jgi:multiple sugar transport system substrate-binding protein